MCWVAVASPSFFSRAKGGNLQRPIGPSVFTVEFFKLKGSEKTPSSSIAEGATRKHSCMSVSTTCSNNSSMADADADGCTVPAEVVDAVAAAAVSMGVPVLRGTVAAVEGSEEDE